MDVSAAYIYIWMNTHTYIHMDEWMDKMLVYTCIVCVCHVSISGCHHRDSYSRWC